MKKYYTQKEVQNDLIKVIKGENEDFNLICDHNNDLYYYVKKCDNL